MSKCCQYHAIAGL